MFLALNSGGIDSPVAAYSVLKKKYELDFIYFKTDAESKEKTLKTVQKFSETFKKKFKLYSIDHASILNEFLEKSGKWDRKFICIFCKRMMYRISAEISEKYGYIALITGENIGQVASQTLQNLYVLEQSVNIPILSMDKQEIIDTAKKIGTYEISVKKSIKCQYVPKYPAINTNLERILKIEEKIDIKKMIEASLKNLEVNII